MKTIDELEEAIYKCSKCGLCQKVCPLYKITGNECTLSRGKFTLLNGVLKKHIKPDNDVRKYLNFCLNCNACKKFCPSDIDATDILSGIKAYTEPKSIADIINLPKLQELVLFCVGICVSFYKFLFLDKLIAKFAKILIKLGSLGRFVLIINSLTGLRIKRRKSKLKNGSKKIVYFQGCINKYINKSADNSVINLLEDMGYQIIVPSFLCCGMSFFSAGKFLQLKRTIEHNLLELPDDIDCIVTDCASCAGMLKQYSKYAPKNMSKKAKKLEKNVVNLSELLQNTNYKSKKNETLTVTWHKPCHFDFEINSILNSIKNINYTKMNDFDKCCGASGSFIVKYPSISKQISMEKAKNIIASKADIVVTNCPSCMLGLKHGLLNQKNFQTKVLNFSEFLEFIRE